MFTGNEGNTFYVESGLDTHLKWRLSLQGGLMYVFHTKFSGQDLGGVGFRLRVGDELVIAMLNEHRTDVRSCHFMACAGGRGVAGSRCTLTRPIPADVRVPPELLRGSPLHRRAASRRARATSCA